LLLAAGHGAFATDDNTACFTPSTPKDARLAACDAAAHDASLAATVRANAFAVHGSIRLDENDAAGARTDFDAAITLNPKDARALIARGLIFETLNDSARAMADYTAALALGPNADAYGFRGALRAESNAPHVLEDAVADLSEARRLAPTDIKSQILLGRTQLRLNRNADAELTLAGALAIAPDNVDALRSHATALGRLEKYAPAIADYTHILEKHPDDMAAHKSRGVAEMTSGDYTAAVADFTTVLAADRKDAETSFFRGTARFRAGDVAGSIADFDVALALRPDDPDALTARGLARATAGDLANGEADLTRVLAKAPRAGLVHTLRGELRVVRGDFAGASQDLAVAEALAPTFESAVWMYIAARRLGRDGHDDLAAARKVAKDDTWPIPMIRYGLGELSSAQLLSSAATPAQQCDANYLLGQTALADGDQPGAARYFTAAGASDVRGSFAYIGARVELLRHDSAAK
jgi:tetratricopeptide (TPR) repeat protein